MKGKYVSPSPIEMQVASFNELEQVCIVGSGLPQPMALVTLSIEGKRRTKDELNGRLEELLHQVNKTLDAHENLEKSCSN